MLTRRVLLAVPLLAMMLYAATSDATGKWKVKFAGDPRTGPKTIGSIILDLKVNGTAVSGTVVMGTWPGKAEIADGKIENGHITFTATGHLESSTGIPTCAFDVTLDGGTMNLALRAIRNNPWGAVGTGQGFRYTGTRAD